MTANDFWSNSWAPASPLTSESLKAACDEILRRYREEPFAIQPHVVLVPLSREREFRRWWEAREVARCGPYVKWQFEEETWWARGRSSSDRRQWPRKFGYDEFTGDYDFVRFNRHARKRGWPVSMPAWMWGRIRRRD